MPKFLIIITTVGVALTLGARHGYPPSLSAQTPPQELDIIVCDPSRGPFTLNITNPYLPFPVGLVNVLENSSLKVQVSVLNQTEVVAGVTTRVIEEREWDGGQLIEVSRNWFVQAPDGTVCYYGEDVDEYSNGQVVGHGGSWRAGQGNAKPGIMMPPSPTVGMVYQMEVAPGIAEETAWITALGQTHVTPAGTFTDTVYIVETGPSYKYYARDVGMIFDDGIKLTSHTGGSGGGGGGSAPVLTLAKTVDKISAQSGAVLAYTITAHNAVNAGTAHQVTVEDIIPLHTVFQEALDGGVYQSGQNAVAWTIAALQPNETRTLRFTVLAQ